MIVRSWLDRLTDAGLGVVLVAAGLQFIEAGISRGHAQSVTSPGAIKEEDESRRAELAAAYATSLQQQQRAAAAWLRSEWEAGRQPTGRIVVMSGDPATSGVVASDYDGERLVTYLLAGDGSGLKGLGWDGHRLVGLALRQEVTAARVLQGIIVRRLGNETFAAPADAPEGAPALVERLAPAVHPPSRSLEWRSIRVACPAGQIGEITERRRYLIERRDGTAVVLRQVEAGEMRTDPDAYRDSEPTVYEPERRGRCTPGSERQETRQVNQRQAPGEPPGVQCWDIERRTVTIRGGAGGRAVVTYSPWQPAGSTCPTGASDPPTDPPSCDPQLTRTVTERTDTGCWGPEPGIDGGWTGTIHWTRLADQYSLSCKPGATYLNYRSCAGQDGCRSADPGKGYYRESYACEGDQVTTTACPDGSGGTVTWTRRLVATRAAGGAAMVSNPPWTAATNSCGTGARVERQTVSCPDVTNTVVEYVGSQDTQREREVVVRAESGEIVRERTITLSGTGPAPTTSFAGQSAPGATNATAFTESAGAWADISNTCVYPSTNQSPEQCGSSCTGGGSAADGSGHGDGPGGDGGDGSE